MSRKYAYAGFAAAACIVGLTLLTPSSITGARNLSGSTLSTFPEGVKALMDTMKELGLPATRLTAHFRTLPRRSGVLFIVGPLQNAFSASDASDLASWLTEGNTGVLFEQGFADATPPGPKVRTCVLGNDLPLNTGTDGGPAPASVFRPPTLAPVEHSAHMAARSGDLREAGSSSTGGAAGVHHRSAASALGLEMRALFETGRTRVPISSPELPGVTAVGVGGDARWKVPGDDWRVIVADEGGPVILLRRFGLGRLFAVCDASIATNGFVAEDRNIELPLAMALRHGRPDHIFFDEYHHGFISGESPVTFLRSSVFAWLFAQGLIGAALLWYSTRAAYAGRFAEYARPVGRPTEGYVDAMANVFDACKASSAALEAVVTRFARLSAKGTGIPVGMRFSDAPRPHAWKNLVTKIGGARKPGPGSALIPEILDECAAVLAEGNEPERALRAAQALARARAADAEYRFRARRHTQ